MESRVVEVGGPVELRSTLRPLTLGFGRVAADGWLRAMRTPDGPATLRLHRPDGAIVADAWGPGRSWVLERVGDIVGAEDHPEDFQTSHPVVSELARRHRGLRFGRTGLVFEALVYAVVSQKVTGKEAKAGLGGLMRRFSDPAPGPYRLRLPPDPERLEEAPYHAFHDLGIERRRADILRVLAADWRRIERLAPVASIEARAHLMRYRGVGAWTAAEVTAVSHGDADAVSVGDFHLKHLVCWNLAGEERGTDERMLELLEPFRPHRGRVVRMLELESEYPRFGPRRPVRSFAAY